MNVKNMMLTGLLLCNATALNAGIEDPVTGHESVYINEVNAYSMSGAPDTDVDHQNTCMQKFGWISNSDILEIDYKIHVKTGMQSASIKFKDALVDLQPMGISKSYSFMTQRGIPAALKELNIRQIYFRLNKEFVLKKVAVSFEDKNLDYQCIAETTFK